MDYSEGFPPADKQLPYFERQVQLACEVSPTHKPRDVVDGTSSMGSLFSEIKVVKFAANFIGAFGLN